MCNSQNIWKSYGTLQSNTFIVAEVFVVLGHDPIQHFSAEIVVQMGPKLHLAVWGHLRGIPKVME